MSKKYIICGVSRAWKTTLARWLAAKYWCSYIPCDPLVTAFQQLYPDLGITHNIANDDAHYDEVCIKFTTFLIAYIRDWLDEELDSYILESFHINIPMLQQALGETHTIIVVWYPTIDPAEKFAITKQYDTTGRRGEMPDEEIKDDIGRFIHLSQKFQETAKEWWVMFVDTSAEYTSTIETALSQL